MGVGVFLFAGIVAAMEADAFAAAGEGEGVFIILLLFFAEDEAGIVAAMEADAPLLGVELFLLLLFSHSRSTILAVADTLPFVLRNLRPVHGLTAYSYQLLHGAPSSPIGHLA